MCTVYGWHNPETTSDYPFLAVAGSVLLSLGNYRVSFDWDIPDDAAYFLAHDFQPTGQLLGADLAMVRTALDATFVGGTEYGIVTFDEKLCPCSLQVWLSQQLDEDYGPEYVIEGFGSYQRYLRHQSGCGPVTLSERAMLDVCVSRFAELAGQCAPLLRAPPPPRFQLSSPG
jgi:hypothetical protein